MVCFYSFTQLLFKLIYVILAGGHQELTHSHFGLLKESGGLAGRIVLDIFKSGSRAFKVDFS